MLLGIGLMVGVGLFFTVAVSYTRDGDLEIDFSTFLVFLTIANSFVVWGGLLPSWTLILCIIVLAFMLVYEFRIKEGGG